MTYNECATAAADRMVRSATDAIDAMKRGDPPERVADYLADVVRWAQRTVEDVNLASGGELVRLARTSTTKEETAEAIAARFRPPGKAAGATG